MKIQKKLKILTKKLGFLIVRNKERKTGIFTDGDIKRTIQKKSKSINDLKIKMHMTKNPISINKDILAAKALEVMNRKKLQVYAFTIIIRKKLLEYYTFII